MNPAVFRDGMTQRHRCSGRMRYCGTHPRWQVVGSVTRSAWYVYPPYGIERMAGEYPTLQEAYAEARRLATKKEEA